MVVNGTKDPRGCVLNCRWISSIRHIDPKTSVKLRSEASCPASKADMTTMVVDQSENSSPVKKPGCSPACTPSSKGKWEMVVERVRAVLYNSRAKGNVLGGPLKDRTARGRRAVLRAEVSASARS